MLLRPRDRHVEQATFLIHRAFHLGTRMRQQAILDPGYVNRRPFEPLATVRRDDRHLVGRRFLLLLAI